MRKTVAASLGALWASWLQAARVVGHDLVRWGVIASGPVVRVTDHKGRDWLYRGGDALVPWAGGRSRYRAFLLDPETVLHNTLRIPAHERALENAAMWEVQAISPFRRDETLWACRERLGDGDAAWRTADLYLAHEIAVREWAASRLESVRGSAEIWVAPGVALPGFGEKRRLRNRRSRFWSGAALAVVLALLLAASLLVPVLESRDRLVEAQVFAAQLRADVASASADRERVLVGVERLRSIGPWLERTPDPLRVLDLLTDAIPDSAFLDQYHQQGTRVQIQGVAEDTAALVADLRNLPGIDEVRIPSAIAADPRTGKERFQIEFEIVAEDAGA